MEKHFKLSPLTTRDAAAPDTGPVLTLTTARQDENEIKQYSRYRYHHYYYGQYQKENS